jgi:hypothetical protein
MLLISHGWLIYAAHSEGSNWGRKVAFVPGYSILFCAEFPKKGFPPLILQIVGAFLLFSTFFSLVPGSHISR